MNSKRVVVVEDSAPLAILVETLLKYEGYQVVGLAPTVRQGLKLVDDAEFDVAIIDANLKGDSAEPIAKRLSEIGIPYVVISGYLKEQIGPWVADKKIIRKPFLIEELIEEIENASSPDQPVAG